MTPEVSSNAKLDKTQVEFLNQLEQQIRDDLREIRAFERMNMNAGVAISAADSSRAGEPVIAGQTVNLSRGGCMVQVSYAPQVGDHYRIQIVGVDVDPVLTFARCVRVVLTKEDEFEAGFQFFAPLELPAVFADS